MSLISYYTESNPFKMIKDDPTISYDHNHPECLLKNFQRSRKQSNWSLDVVLFFIHPQFYSLSSHNHCQAPFNFSFSTIALGDLRHCVWMDMFGPLQQWWKCTIVTKPGWWHRIRGIGPLCISWFPSSLRNGLNLFEIKPIWGGIL